jgi:hypothetical protein
MYKVTHLSELGSFIDNFDREADARVLFALCENSNSILFAALHVDGKLVSAHVKASLIGDFRTTSR